MDDPEMTPHERQMQASCGRVLETALAGLVAKGATVNLVVERMLHLSAVQLSGNLGEAEAAELFRDVADVIEAGAFDGITRAALRRKH